MEKIIIKYFDKDVERLTLVEGKSDWYDLRASEDVTMKAGDFKLVPLGVAMRLPDGYEAHLAPRSSTFKNFGVIQTNSVGVIDNSYSGDQDMWRMPCLAMRDTQIHKGDRICQFRIVEKMQKPAIIEVDHLEGEDRGGFGSTGKN